MIKRIESQIKKKYNNYNICKILILKILKIKNLGIEICLNIRWKIKIWNLLKIKKK